MLDELLKFLEVLPEDKREIFKAALEKAKQESESLTSREKGANAAMNKANSEIEALRKELEILKKDPTKKQDETEKIDGKLAKEVADLKAMLEAKDKEAQQKELLFSRKAAIAERAKKSGVPESLMSHLVNPLDDDNAFNTKVTEFEKAYTETAKKIAAENQSDILVPPSPRRPPAGPITVGKPR